MAQAGERYADELRALRRDIGGDLSEIRLLLMVMESRRIRQAAQEARLRLEADMEGRGDGAARVDVARVFDEAEATRLDATAEMLRLYYEQDRE